MKKVLDLISQEVMNAFESCGYDRLLGKVTLSNRPDLCEYQCNGAMAACQDLIKKRRFMIAHAGGCQACRKARSLLMYRRSILDLSTSGTGRRIIWQAI